MNKMILAAASAVALFGVAACSDTDSTTTQSIEPPAQTAPSQPTPTPSDPAVQPTPNAAPADDGAADEMKPATPAPSVQ